MKTPSQTYYYGHDQLYSPVILVNAAGSIEDRYEYDVYGTCRVLNADFTADADGKPDCGNPYLFTGREVDYLDNGSRPLQYNRHRYYLQGLGRWTSEDPLGISPKPTTGRYEKQKHGTWFEANLLVHWDSRLLFGPVMQYYDGLNLYLYTASNPMAYTDWAGLLSDFIDCTKCQECALKDDVEMAKKQIEDLKKQINAAIGADKGQYPWLTNGKLRNALRILDKASSKLTTGKAKCSSKHGAYASAWPWGDTVTIYDTPDYGFWWINDTAQAAVLVHEGTHMGAATTDSAYFWQHSQSPHDVFILGWDIIASTYDTWILTGFCVPGYSCPSTVTYDPLRGFKECP